MGDLHAADRARGLPLRRRADLLLPARRPVVDPADAQRSATRPRRTPSGCCAGPRAQALVPRAAQPAARSRRRLRARRLAGGLRIALEGAGTDVRRLLLRSADGSYALALWRDVSVWDRTAQRDLRPRPIAWTWPRRADRPGAALRPGRLGRGVTALDRPAQDHGQPGRGAGGPAADAGGRRPEGGVKGGAGAAAGEQRGARLLRRAIAGSSKASAQAQARQEAQGPRQSVRSALLPRGPRR